MWVKATIQTQKAMLCRKKQFGTLCMHAILLLCLREGTGPEIYLMVLQPQKNHLLKDHGVD